MAFMIGDRVQVTNQFDYYGTHLASFVLTTIYTVKSVHGDRVTIGIDDTVVAAMKSSDLQLANVSSQPATTTDNVNPPTNPPETTLNDSGGGDSKKIEYTTRMANTDYKLEERLYSGNKGNYLGNISDSVAQTSTQERINMTEIKPVADPGMALSVMSDMQHPAIIQNYAQFPKVKGQISTTTTFNGKSYPISRYHYDYFMDYNNDEASPGVKINDDLVNLERALNIDVRDRTTLFNYNTEKYNRFKIQNPNDRLSKTYAHVFFVRPDCNIFADGSYGDDPVIRLQPVLENLAEFYRAKEACPQILRQLTQMNAAYNHEFMMYLSNKARSFTTKDEYITTKEGGTALTGYKVPYGKHDVESKTAGTFSINYIDDRDLHIYNTHYLWTSYISYVFRGKHSPRLKYMLHKILDYATCVYYILCAEDGETVIFWTKYWGVFPTNAPSTAFSWSGDSNNLLHDPELSVDYTYAWKEDYNPLSLVEFNSHSNKDFTYSPNWKNNNLSPGYTWVGAPYIETVASNIPGKKYAFKLRFRQ